MVVVVVAPVATLARTFARLRACVRLQPSTCPRDGGRAYSRGYAAGRVAPREPVVLSFLTQGRLAILARSASRAPRTLTLVRVVAVRACGRACVLERTHNHGPRVNAAAAAAAAAVVNAVIVVEVLFRSPTLHEELQPTAPFEVCA